MIHLATTGVSFLPTTLGAWAACCAAIGATAAAVMSVLNRKKIGEVHVLVNGRLDEALREIEALRAKVGLPARRVTDTHPSK